MSSHYSDSVTSTSAAVRRGLDELKPLLAAFASREISKALPGKSMVVSGDIAAIIRTILDHWELAFAPIVPRVVMTYLHETRDVRNRWAHEESFTVDEARRALDTMQLIAKVIGAGRVITQLGSTTEASTTLGSPTPSQDVSVTSASAAGMDRFNALLHQFVDSANGGHPVIASYSWIYGRLNGVVPKPWSQAYGNQVSRYAALTTPRELKGLGPVALDTFIVSTTTRMPSSGYWPKAGHSREAWDRVLGRAMLLHGTAKAPWE